VKRRVWVDGWQMQCCGEPFEVAEAVSWWTSSEVHRDYLSVVVGEKMAAEITHYEDHHDVSDGGTTLIVGTVRTIEAVSCRFAVQGPAFHPVPGTAVIEPRSSADGWEKEDGELNFLGYIVTIE
jgi:hypothetical protein